MLVEAASLSSTANILLEVSEQPITLYITFILSCQFPERPNTTQPDVKQAISPTTPLRIPDNTHPTLPAYSSIHLL